MIRLVISFFAACFACSGQQSALSQVDSIVARYQQPGAPGMSVGVVMGGKLVYAKGIGLASLPGGLPNDAATVFDIASVAKQFTAACIWILVQDGKVTVEDDIRKYLPEMPFYGSPIKIKHLLDHTSGIRNYHALMGLQGFDFDNDYYNNKTVLDLAVRQKGLNNLPGEKVLYSNTNYNLLAIIVERVSGKNLNAFAREHIFSPLGMESSFFRVSAKQAVAGWAGYRNGPDGYFSLSMAQESYGAGNMGSTVSDLAKWMRVLNGTDTRFIELTTFLRVSATLPDGKKAKYARGVMTDSYKGNPAVAHSGWSWGGGANLVTLPGKETGVIILANSGDIDPVAVSHRILDVLLEKPEENLPTVPNPYRHSIGDLKGMKGFYRELNSDMQMEVYIENDTLKSKGSSAKKGIALLPSAKNTFRRMGNETVEYDFSGSRDADMVISFGGTPFYFRRIMPMNTDNTAITDFIGEFRSEELSVSYRFYSEEGKLYLSYKNNEGILLNPVGKDEFGNGRRTLYHFERNEKGIVTRMLLSSEGTVKDILFEKVAN